MLKLRHLEPFAIGGTRRCYVHPDHDDRCVKVLRPDRTPAARRAAATGWRRLKGLKGYDDQLKECKAYRHLIQRGQPDWRHVPCYYGTVETDLGVGIVTTLYRDWNGRFPRNLEQLLPSGTDDAIAAAIVEFKAWLRRELFLTRDLLPHNIIAAEESPGRYRLIVVDGLGNSELIPVSSWFKRAARRKIERKIRKFDHRARILLPCGDAIRPVAGPRTERQAPTGTKGAEAREGERGRESSGATTARKGTRTTDAGAQGP